MRALLDVIHNLDVVEDLWAHSLRDSHVVNRFQQDGDSLEYLGSSCTTQKHVSIFQSPHGLWAMLRFRPSTL
jgi:hypothetical protein